MERRRSSAFRTEEAGRVTVIDEQHGVVLVRKLPDLLQRSDVRIHAEHPVGRDEDILCALRFPQLLREVSHVQVLVDEALRLAQPDAVDDARVVELIADDRIALPQQRLEDSRVRIEARAVQHRVVHGEKSGDFALQLPVRLLGAADEADRGHAVPPALQASSCGPDNRKMSRAPQVVVRAEVEHFTAADADDGLLAALKLTLLFQKTLLAEWGAPPRAPPRDLSHAAAPPRSLRCS